MDFDKKLNGNNNELDEFMQKFLQLDNSINYNFACKYLKNISFSIAVFDLNYKNNENTSKWIAMALDSLKINKKITISDEYYNMPFKFVENDNGVKAIIIEVPNPKVECECNYIGVVKKDDKIRYFTNELYETMNTFGLCQFTHTGRFAYGIYPENVDKFAEAILSF